MSEPTDNTIHDILKRLKTPVFRFIVIKSIANAHFSEILKKRIEKEILDRKSMLISSNTDNYRELMDAIYGFENGIVIIEDFDTILKNKDITVGLNQRRDKIAQLNVALIVMVKDDSGIQQIMQSLPDLWSFRSAVFELEYQPEESYKLSFILADNYRAVTDLDVSSATENVRVLNRRLNEIKVTPENVPFLNSTFQRLLGSYSFLGMNVEGLECARKFVVLADSYKYNETLPVTYVKARLYYAGFLFKNGESERALEELKTLLGFANKLTEPQPLMIAEIKADTAKVLISLGQYSQSIDLLHESIEVAETNLGKEDPITVTRYASLASVYQEIGDLEKAKLYAELALELDKKNFGDMHIATSTSYMTVALIYKDLGDKSTALNYIKKSLLIRERIFGSNDPKLATGYSNLATVLCDLGKIQEALEWYQKAIEIELKNWGFNSIEVAITYSNMAVALVELKNFKRAKQLLEKAIKIGQNKLGTYHPTLARFYKNLASLNMEMRNAKEALKNLTKAAAIYSEVFGPLNPKTRKANEEIEMIKKLSH